MDSSSGKKPKTKTNPKSLKLKGNLTELITLDGQFRRLLKRMVVLIYKNIKIRVNNISIMLQIIDIFL